MTNQKIDWNKPMNRGRYIGVRHDLYDDTALLMPHKTDPKKCRAQFDDMNKHPVLAHDWHDFDKVEFAPIEEVKER